MNTKLKNILAELEKTSSIYWNISRDTAIFINSIIKESGYKTVFEIGTSTGYSGLWVAEALSHNGGHLYTMESHAKGRYTLGQESFAKSGLQKYITHILGHAPEDIPENPKKIDLLFLDATKEEYVEHFDALKNRISKGGMIIADNLYSHPVPLKPFVDKIKSTPGWTVHEVAIGTGLLLATKN
jgi:predicted O-methyltransferase YrrM